MGCWNLIGNYGKLVSEPDTLCGIFEYDVQDSFKQCVFTKQNIHISPAEMHLKRIIPFIHIQY